MYTADEEEAVTNGKMKDVEIEPSEKIGKKRKIVASKAKAKKAKKEETILVDEITEPSQLSQNALTLTPKKEEPKKAPPKPKNKKKITYKDEKGYNVTKYVTDDEEVPTPVISEHQQSQGKEIAQKAPLAESKDANAHNKPSAAKTHSKKDDAEKKPNQMSLTSFFKKK